MIIYRASGEDCDTEDIGVAMQMSCQEEREMLSEASRHNDTAPLCQALEQYSQCIGPKIEGCKGEALMAFNVIKQQYAGEPYNCHITDTGDDEDGDFQNDVNSQHHDDDNDNHIVTNGPSDVMGGVTVSALPGKKEQVKNEEPPEDTKTTIPAPADSKQEGGDDDDDDDDDLTNAAGSSRSTHIISACTALVYVIASLTLPLV
ncbi:hypothetical protein V1264_003456 [Littorina saxatilis]